MQVLAYPTGRNTAEPEPCPSHLSCTLPIGSPPPWLSSSFCWRSLSEAPLSLGKSLPGQWVGVAGLPAPTQPHPELTHWGGCGKAGRDSTWLPIPARQKGALLCCLLGGPDATSCHQTEGDRIRGLFPVYLFILCREKSKDPPGIWEKGRSLLTWVGVLPPA